MGAEPPDKTENVIRFGCGFFAGTVLVGLLSAVAFANTMAEAIIAIVVPSLVCGVAAVVSGDRFWSSIEKWWWWT